ncbi:hypothetical protein Q4I32_003754 [Leishmania shawi]|uniref:G-protein coupled receptors family 1 profile domain-containing protein n=1 Tax=Leishmania shawi TaxID=5680 RepID=A0AAW3BW05_9TRYP
MIFMIVNAVLSAILFMIVVGPPLFIYNPDYHGGEPNWPPSAGEVIPDESVSQDVKQKLYLLLTIPACATINVLFLYFSYYRPIRFIHYRVELNLLTLRLTLEARRQQLQKSGVLVVSRRSTGGGTGVPSSSCVMKSGSVVASHRSRRSERSVHFDQDSSSAQRLESTVNWVWRRHARPKSVRKDVWVNSAVFAEIGDLRDEVEQHFLTEGSVAEANFTKAVGVLVSSTSAVRLRQVDRAAAEEKPQKGFYLSSRSPLSALGSIHSGLGNTARHGRLRNNKAALLHRSTSVLRVPMENLDRDHRRGLSVPASCSGGGSANRLGSNFHFSRGGENTALGRGNPDAGLWQSTRGNILEQTHEPVGRNMSPCLSDELREVDAQW